MQGVLITCQAHHLHPLIAVLDSEFGIMEALQDWGQSLKREEGYLLLTFDGEVELAFVAHLRAEPMVLDVYTPSLDESADERVPVCVLETV